MDAFVSAGEDAEAAGFHVLVATDVQLFVDMDDGADLDMDKVGKVAEFHAYKAIRWWHSKSGIGKHYVIDLHQPVPILERVILQMYLGSDPEKERLTYERARCGCELGFGVGLVRFFQPPDAVVQSYPTLVALEAVFQ